MKFVMNKIMSIDKDAQNYRKNIDELLSEKQNELENIINDLMARFEEECKNIKRDISNEKILEAENTAKNIRKEKEENLHSINDRYQANKLELVDAVFNRVIKLL
ncbi:hypothetical protein [Clostridium lacusfryxellense]|uniref:hypothetical protein n=1 Tax=Clostridium lacusfryxellense TaxID=205328 RepID=UPI001C0C8EC7|nr:hypothetical protein [Clostridium lacusfryxellense]MBU3110440.1 hypothetical protein [Clostridium lacusfryxellense]